MFRNLFKALPLISKSLSNCKIKTIPTFLGSIIVPTQITYFSSLSQNEQKHENKEDEVVDESDLSDEDIDYSQLKPKKEPQEPLETHTEEFQYVEVDNRILIKCSYGYFELKGSQITPEKLKQLKTIYFIHDQVPVNYIRKILKADPNCLVLFEPSAHYFNAVTLYNGFRKKMFLQFFGTKKKPRNPFKKCKNDIEIFNLNRRIKIQIRSMLTRICMIINYDGTLRLKGNNVPFSENLKNFISAGGPNKLGMYKFNYLVPMSYWLGVHSSDEWEKKGITIECLGGKKIYPLYSVWSPTNQQYLSLLSRYLEEKRNSVKSRKGVMDLGCGSGILSFMLAQLGGCKEVYAIDSNIKAAECTKLNAQILDISGAIKVGYMDLVKSVQSNKSSEVLKNMNFPNKYELIIANPPWVVASKMNSEHELDNGIYDPKEEMLKSIFRFASLHLSSETAASKNGTLLLYYSDLSQIMGLQSPERIEKLCEDYNLIIKQSLTTNFIDVRVEREIDHDALINYKTKAKIYLYEITRL